MRKPGYNLQYADVRDALKEIFAFCKPYAKYKADVKYFLKRTVDDGETRIDTHTPIGSVGFEPMHVIIGVKSLCDNMDKDGFVRDKDALWVFTEAFHESAHVWQHSVGFMHENSDEKVKASARDSLIGLYFDEYKSAARVFSTNELFADRYAISQVKTFMERKANEDVNYANIDINGIVCKQQKHLRGQAFRDIYYCTSIDDVVNFYDDIWDDVVNTVKFPVSWYRDSKNGKNNSQVLSKFLKTKLSKKLDDATSGKMEANIFCDYIAHKDPLSFRSYLCIRDEYCHNV